MKVRRRPVPIGLCLFVVAGPMVVAVLRHEATLLPPGLPPMVWMVPSFALILLGFGITIWRRPLRSNVPSVAPPPSFRRPSRREFARPRYMADLQNPVGDEKVAFETCRMAAMAGEPIAQGNLGLRYATGRGVEPDCDEAVKWFRRAVTGGDLLAVRLLRIARQRKEAGGLRDPDEQFLPDYAARARKGVAAAQVICGQAYTTGWGYPPDPAKAAEFFVSAAEQGNREAQDWLGALHATGRGVARDDAKALEWYRLSADQGCDDAACDLGRLLAAGRGAPQSKEEAVRWYARAAPTSHLAQRLLAQMLEAGRGVAPDPEAARRWYLSAAEAGDDEAQYTLGRIFERGTGVPRDLAAAAAWYGRAAEAGHEAARIALKELIGQALELPDGVKVDEQRETLPHLPVGQDEPTISESQAGPGTISDPELQPFGEPAPEAVGATAAELDGENADRFISPASWAPATRREDPGPPVPAIPPSDGDQSDPDRPGGDNPAQAAAADSSGLGIGPPDELEPGISGEAQFPVEPNPIPASHQDREALPVEPMQDPPAEPDAMDRLEDVIRLLEERHARTFPPANGAPSEPEEAVSEAIAESGEFSDILGDAFTVLGTLLLRAPAGGESFSGLVRDAYVIFSREGAFVSPVAPERTPARNALPYVKLSEVPTLQALASDPKRVDLVASEAMVLSAIEIASRLTLPLS